MLTAERVCIEAPDAESAFALEKRLSHLRPTSVGHRDGWLVQLEDNGDHLDEIVAAVRHWLGECLLRETTLIFDGTKHSIRCEPQRDSFGAGFDFLTHVP
jgi:hypothetical protein